MQKAKVGLIGLAVMGANLARNIADKKIPTIVYNRTREKTLGFIDQYGNQYLRGETTLEKFVQEIEKPRKIIVMVKAGEPVDDMINQLKPLLDAGDIIIDCGNSYYKDSERRFADLQKVNLHFFGCGVSGGEEGALHGPSLMPGGSKKVWKELEPIFKAIAAKDFNGKPCVTYLGEGAAGHYVKMVHNGIEYGIMQIMAEAYDLLRKMYKLEAPEIAKIFKKWNNGKLNSYLFEIASKVLEKQDDHKKGYLIDYILDVAEQKGTGAWTSHDALDKGIPLSTVTESVFARNLSTFKETRVALNKLYPTNKKMKKPAQAKFIAHLENALYAAILNSYAQGYELIQSASAFHGWHINLAEVSRIWEGGCIIRAKILNFLHRAYQKNPTKHLLAIPEVTTALKKNIPDLEIIVSLAAQNGIAALGLSSALFYFRSITSAQSSANFIQGLRDFFGAHTYARTDRKGIFHMDWSD